MVHVLFAKIVSQKEFVEANWTVRLPSLLLEDALAELPQTESTHKVLGMKLALESRDAAAYDGLATAAAQGALPGVKVQSTEGLTIQLHEAAISEGLQAVLERKAKEESKTRCQWAQRLMSTKLYKVYVYFFFCFNP